MHDTIGFNYDAVCRKITRKEQDSEAGLDYFGATHYASTMSRIMQLGCG
jgi:hypothetical protein